jgi:hypothetical protein
LSAVGGFVSGQLAVNGCYHGANCPLPTVELPTEKKVLENYDGEKRPRHASGPFSLKPSLQRQRFFHFINGCAAWRKFLLYFRRPFVATQFIG